MESRGVSRSKSLGAVREKMTRQLRSAAESSTIKGLGMTLTSSLRELQAASKRMDEGESVPPKEMGREDRVSRGFLKLRSLYSSNPELVDLMARNHAKGRPGCLWMGMRRDDIPQLLRLLEENFRDPEFPRRREQQGRSSRVPLGFEGTRRDPLEGLTATLEKIAGQGGVQRKVKGSDSAEESGATGEEVKEVEESSKPMGAVKVSRLLPLHVPGPEHLHKNVCIRRYSKEQDGHGGEGKKEETGEKGRRFLRSVQEEGGKEEEEEEEEGGGGGDAKAKEEDDIAGEEEEEDSEGLTIESFLPFFSVTR